MPFSDSEDDDYEDEDVEYNVEEIKAKIQGLEEKQMKARSRGDKARESLESLTPTLPELRFEKRMKAPQVRPTPPHPPTRCEEVS